MVVSVSSSNRNHLREEEHNCFNPSMCVPYKGVVSIASRKMKDADIHSIASTYDGMGGEMIKTSKTAILLTQYYEWL